ncbi:hypothetical protein Sjap_019510 [Stephania japonica]|uniref:Uncharacterized protein n=1 Tax=Stephania japonica TaxID=461633 RepID=A0AAP0HZE9_9MAGN
MGGVMTTSSSLLSIPFIRHHVVKVTSLLIAASMPILKVILMTAVGSILALERIGILTEDATKHFTNFGSICFWSYVYNIVRISSKNSASNNTNENIEISRTAEMEAKISEDMPHSLTHSSPEEHVVVLPSNASEQRVKEEEYSSADDPRDTIIPGFLPFYPQLWSSSL